MYWQKGTLLPERHCAFQHHTMARISHLEWPSPANTEFGSDVFRQKSKLKREKKGLLKLRIASLVGRDLLSYQIYQITDFAVNHLDCTSPGSQGINLQLPLSISSSAPLPTLFWCGFIACPFRQISSPLLWVFHSAASIPQNGFHFSPWMLNFPFYSFHLCLRLLTQSNKEEQIWDLTTVRMPLIGEHVHKMSLHCAKEGRSTKQC